MKIAGLTYLKTVTKLSILNEHIHSQDTQKINALKKANA